MNKDTIIKVLLAIIALMVFAWLWRIISGMLIGTLVLTTSLLSVLIALIIQIVLPIAAIVFAVKLFTKKSECESHGIVCEEKAARACCCRRAKISLALTPDEIDLLRECMKRTEDYYRGLLLLKQDWNAAQNEAAIA